MIKPCKDKKSLCLIATVLVILLLAAVALGIQLHRASQGKTAAKTAVIYQDGEPIRRIPLLPGTTDTFTIESSGDNAGFNTLQIADGKIGISDADCPDKLCVKMGMISSAAYPISCLPHKLVIQIEDTKEEPPVDALTQ